MVWYYKQWDIRQVIWELFCWHFKVWCMSEYIYYSPLVFNKQSKLSTINVWKFCQNDHISVSRPNNSLCFAPGVCAQSYACIFCFWTSDINSLLLNTFTYIILFETVKIIKAIAIKFIKCKLSFSKKVGFFLLIINHASYLSEKVWHVIIIIYICTNS